MIGGGGCIRIDLDPMRPDRGTQDPARRHGDDSVGLLQRHVAIYAVMRDSNAHAAGYAAGPPLMAAEAASRILRGSTFWPVDIVASGTGHRRRRDVAAALFKQANLVAMHVRLVDSVSGIWCEVLV